MNEDQQGPGAAQRSDPHLLRHAQLVYEMLIDDNPSGLTPEAIAAQVQRFRAGLPTEDEFACLVRWSGRAALLHKLDQDQMPAASRDRFQVPDFFMAVTHEDRTLPFLVEVKKRNLELTKQPDEQYLRLTNAYHSRLLNYAELARLPLLMAWQSDEWGWLLFDFRHIQLVRTAYRISFFDALKDNLLGPLLGDFTFGIKENSAVVMRIRRHTRGKRRFTGTLEEFYWETPDGRRANSIEGPFMDIFAFTPDDVETREQEGVITQRFFKTTSEGLLAQRLLVPAAHGHKAATGSWRGVLHSDFAYGLADVRRAAEDALAKGMLNYIGDIVPHNWPDFLPELKLPSREMALE